MRIDARVTMIPLPMVLHCKGATLFNSCCFSDAFSWQGDRVLSNFGASGRNKQPPLATKNLLEDTDGLRRPPF